MAHTKIGNKKKKCENYKMSGHHEENKIKRQERHKKRLERFAKRKEEGKCYKYDKSHVQDKLDGKCDGRQNYNPVLQTWLSNVGSNQPRHSNFCKWRKAFDKLDYQIEKEKIEARLIERKAAQGSR